MAYTLEQLSADIRKAPKADSGIAGKQAVCKLVSKVLLDQEFIAKHLTAEQCGASSRKARAMRRPWSSPSKPMS